MKTIKVRIPVAVTDKGEYWAFASSNIEEYRSVNEVVANVAGDATKIYIVEAEVSIPEPEVVKGTVVE